MRECESCGRCLDDDAAACCARGGTLLVPFPGPPLLDGRYLLERRLGAGGMGAVYEALHVALGKRFAVKVIRSLVAGSPQAVARFRIEARALGRLAHPNVVAVTDYGVDPRDGGLPYLAMELLPGESLLGHLRRHGPLETAEAARLLAPVAAALDHAHEMGILHRDLKPSNVFLAAAEDGSLTPKLLDFGLARLAGAGPDPPLPEVAPPEGAEMPTVRLARRPAGAGDGEGLPSALTAPEGIVGTPEFFAPELIEGAPPSRATDLWAFGVLAYAATTGTLPWEGSATELLARIPREAADPPSRRNPAIPAALDAILLAPLARDPGDRPASASEWVAALGSATAALGARRLRARELPRRALFAAALATAAALAGALFAPFPPFESADDSLLDLRFRLSAPRPADPRLLLVSIDDATLRADAAPLAGRGAEAGRILARAFDAGAAGAAIDLLLPPAWGAAPEIARVLVARSDRIALAALSGAGGEVVGPEALEGPVALALGARAASLFAFANLTPDRDGAVRRARTSFPTQDGPPAPAFAARAASFLGAPAPASSSRFLVDHRVDASGFRRLPFHEAADALAREPELSRGRLLLLGAEYEGSGDLHPNPRERGRPLTGLELQALAIQTLLEGTPLRPAPAPVAVLLALPALFAVTFAVLWLPAGRAPQAVAAAALLLPALAAVAALPLFRLVLPAAAPSAALALGGALALAARRRLPALPAIPKEVPRWPLSVR